jgi:hypothetical protein
MEDEYGSWLIEDLEEYRDKLIKERSRNEMFSDRAEINKMIKIILSEIKIGRAHV